MNDPDTAEPIQQAAQNAETFLDTDKAQAKKEEEQLIEEERTYTDPNRYWFESTACPLIAGTFGPMASAFNICALSSSWRVYIPPEGTEEHGTVIGDPRWVIAINAISLALALIANGSLLLNMSRRLRFAIAQPITIFGFLLSSILLIADLAAMTASRTYLLPASSPAAPAVNHALTMAVYYGIMAAAIYLIIAALMCLTVWGVYKGHYGMHFNLSVAQRTLMLQTMSFFTYMLLGALVFSKIEGWAFLEAVYWADITMLTVGLGDHSPSTHLGRSLLIPYAIGGIVTIGLVIGSIRTMILEKGQKKISARMMEKKRARAINSVDPHNHRIQISRFQTMKFVESFTNTAQKREQEFRVMRSVQDCAERDRKWMALGTSTLAACTLWFVGAAVFMVAETNQQWSYFQSLYFTYICLLTIGYGDYRPLSNSGRPFFILWSLLAVPTLTILISDMGDTVVQAISNVTIWIGSLTVLPGEQGVRASAKTAAKQLSTGRLNPKDFETQEPTGFAPTEAGQAQEGKSEGHKHEETIMDRVADRLASHLEEEELRDAMTAQDEGDTVERDIHFYHFILAREVQSLMKDLDESPPKRYDWGEWEYFIKLMAGNAEHEILSGEELVPAALRIPENREEYKKKFDEHRWSWLSDKSPLMGSRTETEWLLDRIGACLEKELKDARVLPHKNRERKKPPISMADMVRQGRIKKHLDKSRGGSDKKDGNVSNDSTSDEQLKDIERNDDDPDGQGKDVERNSEDPNEQSATVDGPA